MNVEEKWTRVLGLSRQTKAGHDDGHRDPLPTYVVLTQGWGATLLEGVAPNISIPTAKSNSVKC